MSNIPWETTCDRFVAILDIMGFKEIVSRKSHEEVLEILRKLKAVLKFLSGNDGNYPMTNNLLLRPEQTRSITFSDSIFIFSNGNNVSDLSKIALDCDALISTAFKLGIGIKGAISYGKITFDQENNLFFGQPIIDAYLLQNELEIYGTVLDFNSERKLKSFHPDIETYLSIVQYKTPFKGGKISHLLISPLSNRVESCLPELKNLYNTVSGRPRIYVDNTIDFYKFLLEKYPLKTS